MRKIYKIHNAENLNKILVYFCIKNIRELQQENEQINCHIFSYKKHTRIIVGKRANKFRKNKVTCFDENEQI